MDKVIGNFSLTKRLLVWDSFRCHMSALAEEAIRKRFVVMGVILGGCTEMLQQIDVSLNKPVKDVYKQKYGKWKTAGNSEYTKGGNIKCLVRKLKIEFLLEA